MIPEWLFAESRDGLAWFLFHTATPRFIASHGADANDLDIVMEIDAIPDRDRDAWIERALDELEAYHQGLDESEEDIRDATLAEDNERRDEARRHVENN